MVGEGAAGEAFKQKPTKRLWWVRPGLGLGAGQSPALLAGLLVRALVSEPRCTTPGWAPAARETSLDSGQLCAQTWGNTSMLKMSLGGWACRWQQWTKVTPFSGLFLFPLFFSSHFFSYTFFPTPHLCSLWLSSSFYLPPFSPSNLVILSIHSLISCLYFKSSPALAYTLITCHSLPSSLRSALHWWKTDPPAT